MSWQGRLGAKTLLGGALLVAALLIAAPAWADGPAGSDPAHNFPLGGMPVACDSQPDGALCQNAAIYYLDQARASLGQPAYALPADFTSLSPVDRDLILTNLDRGVYGLPPMPGLTDGLDADAANGVTVDDDPHSSDPDFTYWGSNWAGAFPNIEAAYELWTYDDGLGGGNLDCTPTNMSGCWGHRHNILWSFGGTGALAMGVAAGPDASGEQGYTMLLGRGDSSYAPTYTYTWAAAQADGAGTHTYKPEIPQMTVQIQVGGDGTGAVSDSDGQVCTSDTCDFLEPVNQPVTLTETPSSGSVFEAWFGACSGSAPCTITPAQSQTWLDAWFNAAPSGGGMGGGSGAGTGGGSGTGSGGSPGWGGSAGSSGSPGPSGPGGGSGGKTGTAHVITPPRISRLTSSPATIHVKLQGSHLVCKLSRRIGHRWARPHVSHCGASVIYRHLIAGRYRFTVTSGTASVSRIVILRHGNRAQRPNVGPHPESAALKLPSRTTR